MKNSIVSISLLCVLMTSSSIAITKTITNPQTMMVGAKSITLGLTPLISGDISHSVLNPAATADIEQLPFSITSQKLLGEFNYLVVGTGYPGVIKFDRKGKNYRKRFGVSLTYGNLSLNNIDKTVTYDSLPYKIGSFSAGYHLIHLGIGTNIYEIFNIDKVSIGSGIKRITYYVGDESESAIGADIGLIATRYIDYKALSSIEFGGAIHNIISSAMILSKTQNIIQLPFSFLLGGKVNLWDQLSLLSSLTNMGLSLGAEYEIEDGVFLRSSTNKKEIKLGLGLILDSIPTGIASYILKGRLDFNYSQAAFPMNNEPTYVFSLSSLGRSIPKKPEILKPRKPIELIAKTSIDLSGVGAKNTTVRIYNNDIFKKSFLTNKFGNWKIEDLNLKEGKNTLFIKSYDITKDLSLESNYVTIIVDTKPPKLEVNLFPEDSTLIIQIDSNEKLANISAEIDGKKIRLKEEKIKNKDNDRNNKINQIYLKPTQYRGRSELPRVLNKNYNVNKGAYKGKSPPQEMSQIDVFATDESGNSIEIDPIPFFGSIAYPVDKHVHYKEMILAIGNASPLIEAIYMNKEKVKIDDENRFSMPIELNPGKNLIETTLETKEQKTLTFYTRVLHLVSYPDMNSKVKGRREIEFLSTLKILHGDNDGKFYPKQNVTRQFITKLMVLSIQEEEELEEVSSNVFADVPVDHPFASYIQVGVNEGLIFAFPDGTFKPDQELTLSEVIYLMSNAGIINYEEVENADRLISRAELAEFLAYTPKFEKKIEKLINWEKGYDIGKL